MEYSRLGRTDMTVSRICLGTMTWGQQNTEADAHAQMDVALDSGVNFLDTAELYPIPPNAGTQGRTEEIIGSWLKARKTRDKVIIATKVVGPGIAHIRDGSGRHGREQIRVALEGSLRRLGTDHVDLYQIHWPERKANYFGRLGYRHDANDVFTPLDEVLAALDQHVREGKIRAVGLSNETPWGIMHYLHLAERYGWPRMASVQNPYSLLNRAFEVGMAEVAIREDCGLLAYSPLAFGVLSGKYQGGARPPGARLTLFPDYARYIGPRADRAADRYLVLAREHGLDPARMALAYVNTRTFLTSTIIGATTLEQLRNDIASIDLTLSDELLKAIEAVHDDNPNPAP